MAVRIQQNYIIQAEFLNGLHIEGAGFFEDSRRVRLLKEHEPFAIKVKRGLPFLHSNRILHDRIVLRLPEDDVEFNSRDDLAPD